jgi:hypothetical protein
MSDRVLLTEPSTNVNQNNTVFINKGFIGGSDMYSMPNKKINRSSGGSSDQTQVDYDEYWRTKI